VAILDVELTLTQPDRVTALTGIDAVSHAVESFVSRAATPASRLFAREAWRLLATNLPRVFANGRDVEARSAVQLGAAWAGVAIENAMLGGAQAVGLVLPHVVRFNAPQCEDDYADLCRDLPTMAAIPGSVRLADWLQYLLRQAGMSASLADLGLADADTAALAAIATQQWTGSFNPRPFSATDFETLYEASR
jgi:alcohol dehydrogenase